MAKYAPVRLAHVVFEPAGGADSSLSPIIFLHGLTANKEDWDVIPKVVAERSKRRTYAIDARNHGDSEYVDGFSFDANVDDLFHFMDTINAPKAILVGHSMGGITAIKSAIKQPERIEVIFVEDMFTKKVSREICEGIYGLVSLLIQGAQTVPKDATKMEAVKHCFEFIYSQIPADSPLMPSKERAENMKLNMEFRRLEDGSYDVKFNKVAILEALKNHESITQDITGQYDGHAYFIYGGESPFNVGKEEEPIKKHFPRAELIEFQGAMHDVHAEFQDRYIETILQKLQKE